MDVYPLMIRCGDFCVGGALWFRHREKFPTSSMAGFLRSRFCLMLRKEAALNRFFHSDFDPAVFYDQRARREQSRRNRGVASSSGLKDPREEPAEEMTLDLENRRYNFFFTLLGATFRLLFG